MSVIYDLSQVERFVTQFLSNCPEGYDFSMRQVRRRKYGNDGTSCAFQGYVNNDFVKLCEKLQPYDDSVVFVSINPRSWWKAFVQFSNSVLTAQGERGKGEGGKGKGGKGEGEGGKGQSGQSRGCVNLDKKMLHEFMSTKGRQDYWELDVDTKDSSVLIGLSGIISKPVAIIETTNGYHIILHDVDRRLHEFVKISSNCVTLRRDASPPVPGTLQAGFQIRFADELMSLFE